ncbi:hypothetical protein LOTGIDRAFT_195011 [Lottia gigantea]|uniref:Palmitoyltransferase n=1 Tax=Lottia gigantea TaxID=225164 RepID=V3ZVE3_LOTGI|nr:hypothetical protein LOTGIDRAFT_195011 [Lottia gigantea]ESO86565.1 hypothetical protein LOTGIDRAFT_195011 [Lottia gigantea]
MARRWKLPKTRNDRIALTVFCVGGLFLLWYELIHIMPFYVRQSGWNSWVYIHIITSLYLAHNIYGNMYMLATTDTTGSGMVWPTQGTSTENGWRYCDVCHCNYPPRSHHCKICDQCVLKRDHHCWFAGYCIGYHNHRYYLALVFHMVLAAIYCNVYNFQFVSQIKGGFGFWTILSFVGPHVGLMLGYYDLYTFFITTLTSTGSLLLFLFSWMLVIQMQQLKYGQTKHEHKRGIKIYNLGFFNNLKEIVGDNWHLVLLSPFFPSKLSGDGLKFSKVFPKSE